MSNKYTTDQAIEEEVNNMADSIACGAIELNESLCSADLWQVLETIPESDRAYVIDDLLTDSGRQVGYYDLLDITIPVGEIEVQFEGKAEDFFDDVDDWTINGDLAYTTLVGIGFTISISALKEAIKDLL